MCIRDRVRTGRTCVHLVVHQVVQLQHVHVADGGLAIERLAGTAVIQLGLATDGQVGQSKHVLDLGLGRAIEHRCCHRHAVGEVLGQRHQFGIAELTQVDALFAQLQVMVRCV